MEMEQSPAQKQSSPSKAKGYLIAFLVLSILINVCLVIVVVVAFTTAKQARPVKEAVCHVKPNPVLNATIGDENPVEGTVRLVQEMGDKLQISMDLTGFKPDSSPKKHGFHVHQSGDIVTNGCNSAKGHFNPEGKNHGDIGDKERHVGDWANIVVPASGSIQHTFEDSLASLTGKHGILGRAIVIHYGEDDLGRGGNAGSLKTGNAGPRLACCVIVPEN